MPSLSLMEEMKDKASRLIPSPFTEVVEETTSEVLTAPDYEHIMFICDCANRKPDNVVDVIRAVRRRIVNSSPKVQYFTVLLLDALVKNCYEDLHNEIAETKALQRELVNIAIKVPARDGEYEAKKCALTLILNMSYWFIGATCDKTKMLSKLADEVRDATNPLVFEDIESDPSFQLKRAPPNRIPDPQQQQANRRRRVEQTAHTTRPTSTGASRLNREPRIVNAIPVHQYDGDQISGMLDACSLLSECMNAAEEESRLVIGDEMINGVAAEVRQEHAKLAMLITSGAQLDNIDVLLTVSDSQTSIIQRLETSIRAQSAQFQQPAEGEAQPEGERQQAAPQRAVPQQATIVPPTSSSSATDNTTITQGSVQVSRRAGGLRQAHSVDKEEDGEEMVESPLAPNQDASLNADQAPPARQDPLDDFFSGTAAVPAPTASSTEAPPVRRAAPAPYQVMDPKVAVPEASTEEKAAVPAQPADDQDDFDAFLNNRLASK